MRACCGDRSAATLPRAAGKLVLVPLVKEVGEPRMAYRITFGVRNLEDEWKHQLNDIIARHQGEIDTVLLQHWRAVARRAVHISSRHRGAKRTSSVPQPRRQARSSIAPSIAHVRADLAPEFKQPLFDQHRDLARQRQGLLALGKHAHIPVVLVLGDLQLVARASSWAARSLS